jgi:hypothetical protein
MKKKNEEAAQRICAIKIVRDIVSFASRMTMNNVIKIDAKHHTIPESAAIAVIVAK